MTSRIKRRLAVLAMALGLIAAAPYVFDVLTERRTQFASGIIELVLADSFGMSSEGIRNPGVFVSIGRCRAGFISFMEDSVFFWNVFPGLSGRFVLPPTSITLRVACAAALAGVWGLVACGRLLARRWTRAAP